MIFDFLRDLGWFGPVILLIWAVTATLAVHWSMVWYRRRQALGLIRRTVAELARLWESAAVAIARCETEQHGFRALLESQKLTTGVVKMQVVPQLLGPPEEEHGCRRLMDVVASAAPLVGLLGTVTGYFLALSTMAQGWDASHGLAEMAGPTSIAMKSTIGCLLATLVCVIVPGLLTARSRESALSEDIMALHSLIGQRLREERRRPGIEEETDE